MTYFSLGGRRACTKACLTSPFFATRLSLTAIARSRRNSSKLRTGAYVSDLSQLCGSRLPKATILYLALFLFPFSSYLMVDTAMEGKRYGHRCRMAQYCASDITSQHGRSTRPSYSSLYLSVQMMRSFGGTFLS